MQINSERRAVVRRCHRNGKRGRRVGDIRRESGERERDLQRAEEVEGKGENVQVQNQQERRGVAAISSLSGPLMRW